MCAGHITGHEIVMVMGLGAGSEPTERHGVARTANPVAHTSCTTATTRRAATLSTYTSAIRQRTWPSAPNGDARRVVFVAVAAN